MAHDARRRSYAGSTSYPQYDPSIYTDPQAYHSTAASHSHSAKPSPYTNSFDSHIASADFHQSIPPPPSHPPPSVQPIADAVNHAFDNSTAATQVPPDIIARITEQVISSLRAELNGNTNPSAPLVQPYANVSNTPVMNMPMPIPPPPPNPPAPAGPVPPPPPFSPSQTRDTSLPFVAPGSIPGSIGIASNYGTSPVTSSTTFTASRTVHTPPTPDRGGSGTEWDDGPFFEGPERRSSSRLGNESAPRDIPLRTRQQGTMSPGAGKRREDLNERYGDRAREASQPDRPSAMRNISGEEETVLEKMWQPLFDSDGNPTLRLSQFLRGIALHLIEEFEPKHSLVIGPRKMRKFFETMKVSEEAYPWGVIFGLPSDKLSKLYSTLECNHHLISRSKAPYDPPSLAALTPQGFANFMTMLIRTTPDHEFERLAATLLEWPVSNADERKERWPKQLSRRLLPRTASEMAKRRMNDALSKVGILTKPTFIPQQPANTSYPSSSQQNYSSSAPNVYQGPPPNAYQGPPPTAYQGSTPMARTSSRDQPPPASFSQKSSSQSHRNSHSQASSSAYNSRNIPSDLESESSFSSDDEPERKPSLPIERERKPYTAREGGGKVHDGVNGGVKLSRTKSNSGHPPQTPSMAQSSSIQQPSSRDVPGASKITSRSEVSNSSATRTRERAPSNPASYTSSSGKRSTRGRSPPYPTANGSYDRTQLPPQGGYYAGNSYAPGTYPTPNSSTVGDDERVYGQDDSEARFAQYDEEYRNARDRTSGYGNPPLGSGERRYG